MEMHSYSMSSKYFLLKDSNYFCAFSNIKEKDRGVDNCKFP